MYINKEETRVTWEIDLESDESQDGMLKIKNEIEKYDVKSFRVEGKASLHEIVEIFEFLFSEEQREAVNYEFVSYDKDRLTQISILRKE